MDTRFSLRMKTKLLLLALLFSPVEASATAAVAATTGAAESLPVVIVDKAKYELHLANYKNGLEIFKTLPKLLGRGN